VRAILKRRAFLQLSTAGAMSLAITRTTPAGEQVEPRATHDCKVVGDCPIKADEYGAARGKRGKPNTDTGGEI
jgi:hypothetical protein